jgi:7-cyano-7-deazaguanine synthase
MPAHSEQAPDGTGAAAVALVSGGLDSGVACALHLEQGGSLIAGLCFRYGQRAADPEVQAAKALGDRLGFPIQVLDLPWFANLGTSGLLRPDRDLPDPAADHWRADGLTASADAVWVPARNAVFVAIAAAHAEAAGVAVVLAGFNREEAATFPDNSPAFVAAASSFLALATKNQVRVEAPTGPLDKQQIAAEARRLGFPRDLFWSCYRGDRRPCGRCESCRRLERAWS